MYNVNGICVIISAYYIQIIFIEYFITYLLKKVAIQVRTNTVNYSRTSMYENLKK